MDTIEFISLIKKIDLSKVSEFKINSLMVNNKIQFPILTVMVQKDAIIERGRPNANGNIYYSESDITYRTDILKIDEYGRGNRPLNSRFYGSMISKDLKSPHVTIFSEIDEKFNDKSIQNYESIITIGRWVVMEEFEVADICYSDKYLNTDEKLGRYNIWNERIKNTPFEQEYNKELLKLFSDEFAKSNINSHHDYKLSAMFTDFAIQEGLNGVIYPSVKTDYLGFNIVITPLAVEKYLKLIKVGLFKYVVKNGQSTLDMPYFADELGPLNSKFVWRQAK